MRLRVVFAASAPARAGPHAPPRRVKARRARLAAACTGRCGGAGAQDMVNQLNKLVAPTPATDAAPPPSEEVLLLRDIRDSLKSR